MEYSYYKEMKIIAFVFWKIVIFPENLNVSGTCPENIFKFPNR